VLATLGRNVKVPEPILVRARRLLAEAVSVPVKRVLLSLRPTVMVAAEVLVEELCTEPAPAREPIDWPSPLGSNVAPAATTNEERAGRTLAKPARKVPALTRVEPP